MDYEPPDEIKDEIDEDTCQECGQRPSGWAGGLCSVCNRAGMGGDRDK